MKAYVEKSGCIGCGTCVAICPQAFQMNEDGLAEVFVDPIPDEVKASTIDAKNACPVSVIIVEE
ncbi:MAG: ferredoxin [Erysipelotrichaceae bacterium]